MENKIVVITSQYLHSFVENAYKEIELDCEVEVVKYEDFGNIAEVYRQHEESARGFVVSGQIAKEAIVKAVPDYKRPIAYFQADSAGLYKLIIEHLINKDGADAKRIILDFLLNTHEEASIDSFVNVLNLPIIRTNIDKWADTMSVEGIANIEEVIMNKIIRLWDEDKIDGAICLYSSIIPKLEEHGIPCRYPLPEKDQLRDMAVQVLATSALENMRANLPAVIAVGGSDKSEGYKQALKEALKSIKRNLALDMILKEEEKGFHLYTSLKMVDFLTDEQKVCHLTNTLKEDYAIDAVVGYGIGQSITAAKLHAEDALSEALFSGSSYVMNESKALIGPLNGEQCLEVQGQVSKEVSEIAEKCKLSTLTIQKLISIIKMNGNNNMTTQELSERLGVSVRNANRILKNLEKGGAAVITHTQSSISKGRPVKVYELLLT